MNWTRRFIQTTAFFLCTAIFSSSAYANTYYVSPSGDNGNDGSFAHPWQTITKAANNVAAGDTVEIRAGTYNEKLTPPLSGAPNQYITYENYNGEDVLIDAQNSARNAGIYISNKSYIKIIGLKTTGANNYDIWPRAGIYVYNGSNNIIIDGVTTYGNWYGIFVDGSSTAASYVTIKNTKTFKDNGDGTYTGNTQHGIFMYRKVYDSTVGPDNRLAYNTDNGVGDSNSYGLEIGTADGEDATKSPQRIVVTSNEMDHNRMQGMRAFNSDSVYIYNNHTHDNGATGIQIEGGTATSSNCRNIVIENNISENNAQIFEYETGIWVHAANNVLVRNNTIYSNKIGLMITEAAQVTAHNNYIYDNNRGAVSLTNAAGLIVNSNVNDIYVTQNTFYNNGYESGQQGGSSFGRTNAVCDNIKFANNIISSSLNIWDLLVHYCTNYSFNYNDYYNTRALSVSYAGDTVDWTTYKADTLQDANTITSDPKFTNTSTDDYTLQSSSPAINAGTFLTQTNGSGTGTAITVDDAGYFSDGIFTTTGDVIKIGSEEVTITDIDYTTNVITVNRSISWADNANVSFTYKGAAPDMGDFEYTAAAPVLTSITISDSAGYTKSQTPSISVVASGSPTYIEFSCNGGTDYSSWISYADTISSFNITNGATGCSGANGTKTITAKVKNIDNAESDTAQDSTYYDTTAPSVPGKPATSSPTSDATPTWTFTESTDGGSGLPVNPYTVQWCQDSGFSGCDSNTDVSAAGGYTHLVTLAEGTWHLRVKAEDSLGNVSDWSDNGTVDISEPANSSPTVTLGTVSPDPTTDSTPVITGTASDSDGTIAAVEFQVDSTLESWVACTANDGTFDEASESFTCTSGELSAGDHTIYVRAQDNDGDYSVSQSDAFTIETSSGDTGTQTNTHQKAGNSPKKKKSGNRDDHISGTITLTQINGVKLLKPVTASYPPWAVFDSSSTKPSFYGKGSPNGLYVRVSTWPNVQVCETHVIGGAWWCPLTKSLTPGMHRFDIQYGSKLLPPFFVRVNQGSNVLGVSTSNFEPAATQLTSPPISVLPISPEVKGANTTTVTVPTNQPSTNSVKTKALILASLSAIASMFILNFILSKLHKTRA